MARATQCAWDHLAFLQHVDVRSNRGDVFEPAKEIGHLGWLVRSKIDKSSFSQGSSPCSLPETEVSVCNDIHSTPFSFRCFVRIRQHLPARAFSSACGSFH